MDRRISVCRNCPSMCPVVVTIDNGIVTKAEGDADAPALSRAQPTAPRRGWGFGVRTGIGELQQTAAGMPVRSICS